MKASQIRAPPLQLASARQATQVFVSTRQRWPASVHTWSSEAVHATQASAATSQTRATPQNDASVAEQSTQAWLALHRRPSAQAFSALQTAAPSQTPSTHRYSPG